MLFSDAVVSLKNGTMVRRYGWKLRKNLNFLKLDDNGNILLHHGDKTLSWTPTFDDFNAKDWYVVEQNDVVEQDWYDDIINLHEKIHDLNKIIWDKLINKSRRTLSEDISKLHIELGDLIQQLAACIQKRA